MPIPPDDRQAGQSGHIADHNSIADELTALAAGAAAAMPAAQSFPLANNAYRDVFKFTVTGQTDDPLPPFGLVAGSQTYSNSTETTQGPAFWWGYNAGWLSAKDPSSAHGAIGVSSFGDAGDSWNGASGHGLEFNVAFRSQDGSKGTAAFQVVALDDNTNTVWTTLRCGTGKNVNGFNSGIALTRSDGTAYMAMGPAVNDQIYTYVPVIMNGAAALTVSNSAGAQQIVENAQAGQLCGWFFQQSAVNAWGLYESGSKYLVIQDYYSGGGFPLIIWSAAATGGISKQIWAEYPLIMQGVDLVAGSAALATSATKGFLYLPACAGVPTGTPSGHTGTVAAVYDTADNKIYVFNGAWKSVVLS